MTILADHVPAIAQNRILIDQQQINQSQSIQGISGGGIQARDLTQTEKTATGFCGGYISQQPNHLLQIESFADFLRLEVTSPKDTTIVVQGPGGTWCNDDAGSANPMIEGQWQPGLYKIWVGSYQGNTNDNYQIQVIGK